MIESTVGNFWLLGTAVEHNHLYNYQLAGTKNVFASMLQTETPYYQPTPNAIEPFPVVTALQDPDFTSSCDGVTGNCANSWGLRIVDSTDVFIYGAGHYSFFNNYSTSKSNATTLFFLIAFDSNHITLACSTVDAGENCQSRIVSIEGSSSNINVYALNTIGSLSMLDHDGTSVAKWQDNVNVFPSNVILYRTG